MPPTLPSQPLHDLATAFGVATEYWDWKGQHVTVSAESITAVLAALGVDLSEGEAPALRRHAEAGWRRILPPTVVLREGWTPWVPVHLPHGARLRAWLELEDGSTRDVHPVDHWVEPRTVDTRLIGQATIALPGDLPTGWHRLIADIEGFDESTASPLVAGSQIATVIVTPARLDLPPALREGRVTGLATQLYQVRSHDSWGIGDLGDLGGLAAWAARLGAGFVLINPLHAAEPTTPMEPSPYLPTTRRFVNPIYLRVDDIPEIARTDAAGTARIAALALTAAALNLMDGIDRNDVWSLKREALEIIHAAGLGEERAASYAAYREREGEGLTTFATWCALVDVHGQQWRQWPEGLHDPQGADVTDFAAAHRRSVDFHAWLQWLLDGQLGAAHEAATSAGMALGIISDLAVGVHPRGADAWGLGDALATGVTVGAPPDQFNQLGQDWSQPPWRPDRLAELGYAPFRDMVRTVLRDSGGIRVDHIIGLFRLWWIPEGGTPADGTYVHYDHEALIGILVLEAQRAGAVVIGEDLGVVAPHVRDHLLERGLLGTSILWFEWEGDAPKPAEHYRDLCLASVTTHDLPPTAGYLTLEHVALRERLGLLTVSPDQERAHERAAIARVAAVLAARGLLPDGDGRVDGRARVEEFVLALHRWLSLTPSRMLAVALADVVGDRRAVNQPGTNDEYPNWRVPLTDASGRIVLLEDLLAPEVVARAAALFSALT